MTVHPMQASVPTPATTTTGSTTGNSPDDVTQNDFLQLLVAQLQHQDPSSPADSTTFVTQLAQFSQLEQIIAIRGDIEGQGAQAASSATTGTTPTQGGN